MSKKKRFTGSGMALLAVLCSISPINALDNGLAKTPPMGWNSWNCFGENINQSQIKEIADVMVSSGLRDAGYVYLCIDDNWMATSRDANGNLQAHPTRFSNGMKALGDYIHSKGLKFGIYGDRGRVTCVHRDTKRFPMTTLSGSIGREERDANTFASWGVDYLKYDNCDLGFAAPSETMQKDYETMRDALAKSGRDIVFSICAWEYRDWMPKVGNLWRTTTDILNIWKKGNDWSWGILDIIDLNEKYAPVAKPGAWNDPDMLQVGNTRNGGPTTEEYRTHFSLWCIMAAPLMLGNDIRNMSQATKDIILNKEVIAVDQDSAGIQGTKIKSTNGLDVWCKPLGSKNGNIKAVALFNRNNSPANITVNFSDIGLKGEVYVRDLWAKSDKGKFTGSYTANSVPAHGTVMLKISGEPPKPKSAFDTLQAEDYSIQSGIQDETCNTSDRCIGYIENGDYVVYDNIVFDIEPNGFEASVSSNGANGGSIEIRLDSLNGTLLGTCVVPSTGSWSSYITNNCTVTGTGVTGNHKIYLKFVGESGYLLNINWFRFLKNTVAISFKNANQENSRFTTGRTGNVLHITPLYENSKYTVSIFSPRGQRISYMNDISKSISLPVHNSGIYIIEIKSNGKRELHKVTVHR
ncbi:MAG: carbohydrate-binding protein [Fibrobacter sp.]|nr:carbohydrate-binding protein [Fibrobacter sp.]